MDKDVSGALRRLLLLAMLGLPLVAAAAVEPQRLVDAARAQVGVTLGYDPAYRQLDYPGGDVPLQTGVCTDVVVRALRGQGLDLQKAVHEDMRRHFAAYPQQWGMKGTDRNIDHRRLPGRRHSRLAPGQRPAAYRRAFRSQAGGQAAGVAQHRCRRAGRGPAVPLPGHRPLPLPAGLNGLGKPFQRRMSAARFLRRSRWTAGKKKPACGRFSCLPGLSDIRRGRRCPGRP